MATLSDASKTQSATSHLYTRLASDTLGETAAVVISSLISYGRSTAKDICSRTKLTLKQVRTALVSLIQLNAISYWTEKNVTHFYFKELGMQVLLHAGEIITHIKSLYGEEAAEVVQNIIENGNICVRDYVGSFDLETQYKKMAVLVRLYNGGWLRRLQPVDFSPLADLWNQLYQETLKNTPRSATTSEVKRVAEAKAQTKVKLDNVLAAGQSTKDAFYVESGIHKLRPELTLILNFQRYEKFLRSRALVSLANSRLGLITAQIYAACCSLIEQKSPDLSHPYLKVDGLITEPEEKSTFLRSIENGLVDNKLTVFSVRDVARALPKDLDLRNSILTQNFLKPKKRVSSDSDGNMAKRIKLEDGLLDTVSDIDAITELGVNGIDEDTFDGADETEFHSIDLVNEHMRLLCASNITFAFEVSPGSYTIPFMQLSKNVKQLHYDTLIKTTLGYNAFRVLRCIKDMKLVDEKAISNSVLLKEKTVKSEVFKLVTNNVVELQEVPRSADRAASKTFYLFRHKEFTSYSAVAQSLLFTMGEILNNIESFKQDHRILLDKCEREDVKGHEEEFLLDSELKVLRDLQVREVGNIGRFNRVKWLYFIFGLL